MLQWLQPKGCGFFDWGGKSGGICFLGGLLISALTFFVKRGMDKKDARDKEQDKRITEVEDKLNNAINQMPFLYTLREDFIRSNAQQNQKLDQIITLLMEKEGK